MIKDRIIYIKHSSCGFHLQVIRTDRQPYLLFEMDGYDSIKTAELAGNANAEHGTAMSPISARRHLNRMLGIKKPRAIKKGEIADTIMRYIASGDMQGLDNFLAVKKQQ